MLGSALMWRVFDFSFLNSDFLQPILLFRLALLEVIFRLIILGAIL